MSLRRFHGPHFTSPWSRFRPTHAKPYSQRSRLNPTQPLLSQLIDSERPQKRQTGRPCTHPSPHVTPLFRLPRVHRRNRRRNPTPYDANYRPNGSASSRYISVSGHVHPFVHGVTHRPDLPTTTAEQSVFDPLFDSHPNHGFPADIGCKMRSRGNAMFPSRFRYSNFSETNRPSWSDLQLPASR